MFSVWVLWRVCLWVSSLFGTMHVVEVVERLTWRHAIKLVPLVPCSMEEAVLAVGQVVGYGSIKSASRMNRAIVMFLDSTAKVSEVVEKGVAIHDTFTPVLLLISPANVPPFIKNEVLAKELPHYHQFMSQIKMVSLGCKSSQLKHVMCHQRQMCLILQVTKRPLNLQGRGFQLYMVFASSVTMQCFSRGMEGHLIRAYLEELGDPPPAVAGAPTPMARAPAPMAEAPAPMAGAPAPMAEAPAQASLVEAPALVAGVETLRPVETPGSAAGEWMPQWTR